MSDAYLLALETSSTQGSVALLCHGQLLQEIDLAAGLRHGQALLPAARTCLQAAGLRVEDLTCVAVGTGPGSYTGTRIGVMAAKALAFGGSVALVGISSLAALAWEVRDTARFLVPVQPARRDEVYVGVYETTGAGDSGLGTESPSASSRQSPAPSPQPLIPVLPDRALTPEEAGALAQGADYLLVGAAVSEYAEVLRARAHRDVRLAEDPRAPAAAAVGALAWQRWLAGDADDVFQLQPVYLRREGDPAPFD